MSMETFGIRLKELRLEKGLSQVELAKKLNVGKSIISVWEKGQSEPSIGKVVDICEFFGVTFEYLVGLED